MAGFAVIFGNHIREKLSAFKKGAQLMLGPGEEMADGFLPEADPISLASFSDGLAPQIQAYADQEIFAFLFTAWASFGDEHQDFAQASKMLHQAYQDNQLSRLLAKSNGVFSGLIYDSKKKRLIVFTDRFGTQPVYWAKENGVLWIATQLKPFPDFFRQPLKVDQDAAACFLQIGHFLGKKTWFENICLIHAATLMEWTLPALKVTENRYWTWSKIQAQDLSFEEASEKLQLCLNRAVQKRINSNFSYSIGLSGGLDSRMVTAAMPTGLDLNAYTFCWDAQKEYKLAKRVAQKKGIPLHVYEINPKNWWKGKMEAIWKTDGQISFIQLHPSPFTRQITQLADLFLNGFAGDLIAGGSYLSNTDIRINETLAQKHFGKYADQSGWQDSFFDFEKTDPFFLDTRVRRFTLNGILEIGRTRPVLLPFLDTELIEFVYGLPDRYRKHGQLYHTALLAAFPDFFKTIPWQKTGFAIRHKLLTTFATRIYWPAIRRKISKGMSVSLAQLLKTNPAKNKLDELFDPKHALINQILEKRIDQLYWRPFLDGNSKDFQQIANFATMEIFLRQVFRGINRS